MTQTATRPPVMPPGVDRLALEAAVLDAPAVPRRVLIAPWGDVQSSSGAFVVDEAAAAEVLAAFEAHATDLPIDYEHQTLGGAYSAPDGLAPAAGWITALKLVTPDEAGQDDQPDAPGIWADVEWTDEAANRLRGKTYRYLSPVVLVRRTDRRLVGLHSAALTNKPAIVGMRPVVNRAEPPRADDAPSANDLRRMLALDATASADVLITCAARRLADLEQAAVRRSAEERVARAMSAGKLTPAQREWALALAERDPDEFERWEAVAPTVVALGRVPAPRSKDVATGGVEAAARAEYRAHHDVLSALCSEDAYVANAVRDAAG